MTELPDGRAVKSFSVPCTGLGREKELNTLKRKEDREGEKEGGKDHQLSGLI